jgi:hypothetical protein
MKGKIIKSTGSWYQVLEMETGKSSKQEFAENLN